MGIIDAQKINLFFAKIIFLAERMMPFICIKDAK